MQNLRRLGMPCRGGDGQRRSFKSVSFPSACEAENVFKQCLFIDCPAIVLVARTMCDRVADVASDLDISRQAVYDIKKGKYCPSLSLVQKACEVWKVPFSFRGMLIDGASFKKKSDDRRHRCQHRETSLSLL